MDNIQETPIDIPVKSEVKKNYRRHFVIGGGLIIIIIIPLIFYLLQQKKLQIQPSPPLSIETKHPVSTQSAIPKEFKPLSLLCPTTASFCQNKNLFNKDALEIKTAEKLPVFAVFDGKIDVHYYNMNPKDAFYLILLTNQSETYRAVYYLKGNIEKDIKQVKAGQQIAKTDGQYLSFRGNNTLILEVKKLDKTTEPMNFGPGSFK